MVTAGSYMFRSSIMLRSQRGLDEREQRKHLIVRMIWCLPTFAGRRDTGQHQRLMPNERDLWPMTPTPNE